MNKISNINVLILSDFDNFKNNVNKIFSTLNYDCCFSFIDSILDLKKSIIEFKPNLIVINKSSYSLEEVDELISIDFKSIGVILVIDCYFKYEDFFKNFEKGIITLRRPVTVNKFIEVTKICIYSNWKKINASNSRLIELRTIDFAKTLLIIYKKLNEDSAHKFLEHYSMRFRMNIFKSSKSIISYYMKEKENIIYEY